MYEVLRTTTTGSLTRGRGYRSFAARALGSHGYGVRGNLYIQYGTLLLIFSVKEEEGLRGKRDSRLLRVLFVLRVLAGWLMVLLLAWSRVLVAAAGLDTVGLRGGRGARGAEHYITIYS